MRPPRCSAHARQDQLGEPHQAEEVGLELAAYLRHRHLLDRPVQPVAGVVDQRADRPGVSLHGGDGRGHGRLVGHVKRHGGDATAGQIGERVHPPGGRVHAQPGMVQADRGGAADPGRAAGDENRIRARSAGHGVTPFWLSGSESRILLRPGRGNAAGHRHALAEARNAGAGNVARGLAGSRSGRFPAQAVVVLADDGLTVSGDAAHAGIGVRAELPGFVAVAAAGRGIAAARCGRRRSGLRSGRRGRLARRERHPGEALLAVRRHPDSHR